MEIAEPISPKPMGSLLDSRNERIKVPSYQRRFSWKEEHFQDLWNDLQKIDEGEKHFFGTIVFMSGAHVAQSLNEVNVVDGQQRTTTVSVLICAIRDYLREQPEEEVGDRIETIRKSLWLVDRDGNERGLRIQLGNLDKESYQNLVNSNLDDVENENLREAPIFWFSHRRSLGTWKERGLDPYGEMYKALRS